MSNPHPAAAADLPRLVRPRVAITGLGAATPLGLTAAASWESLLAGRSGIGPITRFDASILPVRIAGEVKEFQPETFMDRIPISGSKALLGHALGGAGAIEAIFCMFALRDNIIPPTWNYGEPDPACDLDYVPNQPRPAALTTVVSNSFAMGGHNTCLVFRRYNR